MGPKGCFPFITFGNTYKMISMSKVKFGIDASGVCRVKEVGNEWKGVTIFLDILFKPWKLTQRWSSPVFLFTKRTIALCGEHEGVINLLRRLSSINSHSALSSDSKRSKWDQAEERFLPNIDLEVVQSVLWEFLGESITEYISKVVIF